MKNDDPPTAARGGPIQDNSALVLIDVQDAFDDPRWGERNNPEAEARMADLLAAWRRAGRPVIHVQHLSADPDSPLAPGKPGVAIKAEVTPAVGEPVFQKRVNSAFIGTDLERHLRAQGIDSLVIAGLTTDHCVSTTARMAGNLGFRTWLVSDATATFGKQGPDGNWYDAGLIHATALASLHGEFAEVVEARVLLEGA